MGVFPLYSLAPAFYFALEKSGFIHPDSDGSDLTQFYNKVNIPI